MDMISMRLSIALIVCGVFAIVQSKQCPNSQDVCVPIKFCQSIEQTIRRLAKHPNNQQAEAIRQRACHSVDETEPRVCCGPKELPVGKPCQTDDGYRGRSLCVAPQQCRIIANYQRRRQRSATFETEMDRSLCYQDQTSAYYCCPEGHILANQTRPVDKPQALTLASKVFKRSYPYVENVFDSCKDPSHKAGFCVPARQCYRINQLISTGAVHENRALSKFVRNSRCLSDSPSGHSVCCSVHSTDSSSTATLIPHPKAAKLGLNFCGRFRLKDKILAGEEAGLGQYPWMATLMYMRQRKLQPLCAGSLIHPRYVLTAAHCLKDKDGPHRVRLGDYKLDSNPDCDGEGRCLKPFREYNIAKQIVHENFNKRTADYDVGLVQLEHKAAISEEQIYPICLPLTENLQLLKPKKLTVAGWGFTEHSSRSSVLLEADTEIVGRTYLCEGESTFCSRGRRGENHCKGDSGGPYQAVVTVDDRPKYVLFGIISGGPGTCSMEDERPSAGTMVGYHLTWILDNMNI